MITQGILPYHQFRHKLDYCNHPSLNRVGWWASPEDRVHRTNLETLNSPLPCTTPHNTTPWPSKHRNENDPERSGTANQNTYNRNCRSVIAECFCTTIITRENLSSAVECAMQRCRLSQIYFIHVEKVQLCFCVAIALYFLPFDRDPQRWRPIRWCLVIIEPAEIGLDFGWFFATEKRSTHLLWLLRRD